MAAAEGQVRALELEASDAKRDAGKRIACKQPKMLPPWVMACVSAGKMQATLRQTERQLLRLQVGPRTHLQHARASVTLLQAQLDEAGADARVVQARCCRRRRRRCLSLACRPTLLLISVLQLEAEIDGLKAQVLSAHLSPPILSLAHCFCHTL